jgi:hypothetical protein
MLKLSQPVFNKITDILGFPNHKISDSARHQDICLPISQIVMKNFININLIIKESPEEILIKLEIVMKISKFS